MADANHKPQHRYWSTERQRWVYPGESGETLPKLPEPVGHVNMQTRSGSPDGITWTGWAQPHGSPLFTVTQMESYSEAAVRLEMRRLASQIAALRDAGSDMSLSDVESLILYGKGAPENG